MIADDVVCLKEQISHLEKLFVEFETKQREITKWLDKAEDSLSHAHGSNDTEHLQFIQVCSLFFEI